MRGRATENVNVMLETSIESIKTMIAAGTRVCIIYSFSQLSLQVYIYNTI